MLPDTYKSGAYMGKLIPSLQCYFYYDCRMFLWKDTKRDQSKETTRYSSFLF